MKQSLTTFLSLAFVCSAIASLSARAAPSTSPAPQDQIARERWFADLLTNAVMVGSYTAGNNGNPRADRYTILKAVKGEGDNWVITARIEYKGIGLPVDITVPVRWAGDTPVMQLTDQKIPGLGTFTCRIVFYRDQYAGTWDAGDHGGLMWGRVERAKKNGGGGGGGPTTKPAQ